MRVSRYAPGTPCWSELVSADPAAAVRFYRELFGWEVERIGRQGRITFELGGAAVGGVGAASAGVPAHGWLTYLATDDAAATAAAASSCGGTVYQPSTLIDSIGRLAILADAEGAVFGVWQKLGFAGAQAADEPGTICWYELATWDRPAATAFYSRLFGWADRTGDAAEGFDYRVWLSGGDSVAGMVELDHRAPAGTPAHWRITFEVRDCAGMAKRCLDLGGQVSLAPVDVGVGVYARLVDDQGAGFGIIELAPE